MLDKSLVTHCAPTLARLKPGSIFTLPCDGLREISAEMRALRAELLPKGVVLTVLGRRGQGAIFYLYRPGELERILSAPATQGFLRRCGYGEFSLPAVLRVLRARLRGSEDFPHEIGVFLGYPLADVVAFIRNAGRNCLFCGCWKVYSDARGATLAFARFRKCKEVYARLFQSGCPLSRLTVGAKTAT